MRKMLRKFLAWVNDNESQFTCEPVKISPREPDIDWRRRLNFSFTRAHSGAILIVEKYNKEKDEHDRDVYVIRTDSDSKTSPSEQITSILEMYMFA